MSKARISEELSLRVALREIAKRTQRMEKMPYADFKTNPTTARGNLAVFLTHLERPAADCE